MTQTNIATIAVDQFIDAPPSKVWRSLTDPGLHARWWVPGDIAPIVGHRFHLQMPGWGPVACEILEAEPAEKLVYTFNTSWTLTWRLVAEGTGTRLLLEHSGFNLDDKRDRDAYDRMSHGWRDILPRLTATVSN